MVRARRADARALLDHGDEILECVVRVGHLCVYAERQQSGRSFQCRVDFIVLGVLQLLSKRSDDLFPVLLLVAALVLGALAASRAFVLVGGSATITALRFLASFVCCIGKARKISLSDSTQIQ